MNNTTSSNEDMLRELFSLAQKQEWEKLICLLNSLKDGRILYSLGDNMTTTDEQGTLLHIVCSCPTVTTHVVETLLQKAGNDLLLVQDSLGHIPLNDAVRSGAPLEVIQLLVTNASAQVKDNLCLTPLDHVCERIIMREERHRYEKRNKQEQTSDEYFWQCARLILIALGNITPFQEQQECKMLHACIRAHSSCPLSLFHRILKQFAKELKLPDSRGNLPLHIAAGHVCDEEEDVQVIQQVLEAHPAAIRVANQQDGHFALDKAISAGRTWSTGCQILFQAFPEAILISQNHSVPMVHLALILSELSSKGCMDSVYKLLMAQPELFRRTL
jgi:hypothetical protein